MSHLLVLALVLKDVALASVLVLLQLVLTTTLVDRYQPGETFSQNRKKIPPSKWTRPATSEQAVHS